MSSALLITALSVIGLRSLREGKARRLLIVPLFVISGLLVYGADKGGRLVFEFRHPQNSTICHFECQREIYCVNNMHKDFRKH